MSSRSGNKPQRFTTTLTRSQWRAARREAAPHHHAMDEKFAEDRSTTKAVKNRQNRAYWNMKGLVPPPMDSEGRPLD